MCDSFITLRRSEYRVEALRKVASRSCSTNVTSAPALVEVRAQVPGLLHDPLGGRDGRWRPDPVPLATHNPGKTKARPVIDRNYTPTVSLSRAESDRLLDEADAESLLASVLIRLLLAAGLRIGSAIGADIDDVGHDRGHRVLTLNVKGGHKKVVPIPPFVGELLDYMLAERGNPADGPLFITPRQGVRVYELYVWRLIRRLGRRAGVPQAEQLSPHPLRHTAITQFRRRRRAARSPGLRRARRPAHHPDHLATAVESAQKKPSPIWSRPKTLIPRRRGR